MKNKLRILFIIIILLTFTMINISVIAEEVNEDYINDIINVINQLLIDYINDKGKEGFKAQNPYFYCQYMVNEKTIKDFITTVDWITLYTNSISSEELLNKTFELFHAYIQEQKSLFKSKLLGLALSITFLSKDPYNYIIILIQIYYNKVPIKRETLKIIADFLNSTWKK